MIPTIPTIPRSRAPRSIMLEAASALVRRLQTALTSDQASHGAASAGVAEGLADLIIVTPEQREWSEIIWYPYSVAWALLRQEAPLLIWPRQERAAAYVSSGKPLIAVPFDGHARAERAVPVACALAEIVGGEVVLVHVAPRAMSATARDHDDALQRLRQARRSLRAARRRATAQSAVPVSTKLLLGEPGSALVAFAGRSGVGAVVMTTHSERRNPPYLAGTVATQVMHAAAKPTLLIPTGSGSRAHRQALTQS